MPDSFFYHPTQPTAYRALIEFRRIHIPQTASPDSADRHLYLKFYLKNRRIRLYDIKPIIFYITFVENKRHSGKVIQTNPESLYSICIIALDALPQQNGK